MAIGGTKVVQVTNIAPQATKDQMHVLFGYLGKIEDIRLYPTIRDVSCPVQSRICYIKFVDVQTVGIAQHMTNTVFIDRALIVIPVPSGEIPDEYYALEMTRNGTIVPGLGIQEPKLPPHVVNSVHGSGEKQVILTTDTNLDNNDLAPYPPLPSNYDTAKIEETRRTILMLNYDPSVSHDDIIKFLGAAGEVRYLRICKQNSDDSVHMLVEYTDQSSIVNALKMNGMDFHGKPVKIQHATQPIAKPQAKSNEAAQKEIEEAMSRFKEAQNMINASIEPVIGMLTKDKRSSRRSRSRSRGRRRRTRSRSPSRRRSRSRRRRSISRRRSKSRDCKRRSKSRSRRRSHSRSRRSGSRSSKSRRSRSKSRRVSHHRSRERSSRGKSRERDKKSRDRSRDRKRSRDRDRDKKSRDRESTREKLSRDSKEKRSDKESSLDVAPERKLSRSRSKSRDKSRRRSRSRNRKTRDRKRSRSRGSRRRSPTPPRSSRKRSRSRSRDKKRDRKSDKRDKDRIEKDRRSRSRSQSIRSTRSQRSQSKVPRNYDEEEKGFDTEKIKEDFEQPVEKGSPEKSDNMDISNSP